MKIPRPINNNIQKRVRFWMFFCLTAVIITQAKKEINNNSNIFYKL